MNGPKQAHPDHPINELIAGRWSPYCFSDRPVPVAELRSLFEAARWAASSYNEQPWSYIVATRDNGAEFARVLSCLIEPNQVWAQVAPVLAIGCTSLKFARNGQPNAVALHDLGLASANLCLEATARGIFVHQMAGIVHDKVRAEFHVPEGVQPLTALAIGYAADPNTASEQLKPRDLSPRSRKQLAEFVFGGEWGTAAEIVK